jgi:hypothetical protein
MIYISNFLKTVRGVEEILRLSLRNMEGYDCDITGGRDL